MPATPAWPSHSLPRLFVDQLLSDGLQISLEGAPANYLGAVLRLGEGAQVKLFDDRSGEWLGVIEEAGKRRVRLRISQHLRPREQPADLWLLFAPIKRGRIDWLVEKATELGVSRLQPVLTRRTIVDRLNLERLRAHAIEAAEQCERTALPELLDPVKLDALLQQWSSDRDLLFADEAGGTNIAEASAARPAAILIGPEGGFMDDERRMIASVPSARPVSLGPNILRADTAALAAVSVWMAASGEWNRPAISRSEIGWRAPLGAATGPE
jgi:16S rRNA (uracil1498-N3)-methyltransferase